MKVGVVIRNMGPQATRQIIGDCARGCGTGGL